jgi:hypothetical protein
MSKWKTALRALSQKSPSKDIAQTILNTMRSEADDRTTAIVAAAFVEVSLVGPIAQITGISGQKAITELFWDRESLFATFSRKIEGATLLRVIGAETASNLEVIRHVRNAFAHSLSDVSFTTPEVERACARLTLSSKADFFVAQEQKRKTRYRYCYACDGVFRPLLNYVAAPFVTGTPRPAGLPSRPVLP